MKGKVNLLGLDFNNVGGIFSTTEVIISDDIPQGPHPPSSTNNLPVFFTESIIILLLNGFIILKSMFRLNFILY